MRKLLCILLATSLSLSGLLAQVLNKDSLLTQLQSHKEDSNKVRTLYELARNYEKSNLDSATYYLNTLRRLSDSLNHKRGVYLYYERMAVVSFTNGDFDKAMEESRKGLELAKQLGSVSFEIVMLNNIAICYEYLGKYQEQLDYTLKVKNRIEETKDSAKLSGLYQALSNVYANLGQHRRSADYSLLSIHFFTEYKKRNDFINRVYAGLAQSYEQLNMPDSAIIFYEKAISESNRLKDKFAEGTVYQYATNFYSTLGRYDKMFEMANRSLVLAKELNSRQLEATAYYNVAAANYYTNNNKEAHKNIRHALDIAIADSIRNEMQNGYRLLSYIAARDGDFIASAKAMAKSDSIQQTGLNEKVAKDAADLEKKYETEKKESQIKLQEATIKQKNTLNYIFIGSTAALLLLSFLSYRTYQQKRKLQQQRIAELETEKQLLATQSLLKGQEDERSRLAKDLHDGLGGLLSGVKLQLGAMKGNLILSEEHGRTFNNALNKLDESISEMRRVAHNMMPEALMKLGLQQALQDYCDGLSASQPFTINTEFYGLEQRLEASVEIAVYRIVQELLNNTVKHAEASAILAQVIRRNDNLTITVEDNGKGFAKVQLDKIRTAGLHNIQSRVNYLSGQMDIQSEPGKGTSVHIDCTIENNG